MEKMIMKDIRQQFHRFGHMRSPIWKASLVISALSLFTVGGWVGHWSFEALQRHSRAAGVQAGTNHIIESQLQAQAAELACLRDVLEQQRTVLQSVISKSKGYTTVQAERLSLIENKFQRNTRRLKRLEMDRAMVERITGKFSAGVCMILGEYTWIDGASGRPLRYEGMDASGEPLRWPDGQARVRVGGHGPVVAREFTGTGFLIDSAGAVLTSGYLLRPWERDPLTQRAASAQIYPRIHLLHAYFPDLDKPFDLTIAQASENEDTVICRFDPGRSQLPGLPLQQADHPVSTGEPVVLLGYPGGTELMMARLPQTLVNEFVRSGTRTHDGIAQELARRRLIQPLAIQGRISGQLGNRLFYDGTTTFGGSGGPMVNKRGEVVGIEFAISPEFTGSNLAISIGSLQAWLTASGYGTAPRTSTAISQLRNRPSAAK